MQKRVCFVEFTKPEGKFFPIFSWLIRAADNTDYSHVRVRWINTSKTNIVYEASGSSVKFMGPPAQKANKVKIVYSYELEIKDYRKLVKVCMEYAGIDYGTLQILGIALARLANLSSNPLSKGDSSQVCSELLIRICVEALGIPARFFDYDWDLASPKDVKNSIDKWISEGKPSE